MRYRPDAPGHQHVLLRRCDRQIPRRHLFGRATDAAAACAALALLAPSIWRHRADFLQLDRPGLQLIRVVLSTLEVAAFFLGGGLSAAGGCHHLLFGLSDLRHRGLRDLSPRIGRLAALERDLRRLLRCTDRAAAVGADGDMAGADRARRQPVLRRADAHHPLAAFSRRTSCSRPTQFIGTFTFGAGLHGVRMGDARSARSRPVLSGGRCLGLRAALRQSLAEAGAGEHCGAVSVFDDHLGGDLRLFSCSANCRRGPR